MKSILRCMVFLGLVSVMVSPVLATNGDNLIAIGPVSRAMGGVGIAAPQDAISAVFSNPAAMSFSPYCPGSEFDFAGTLFMPHVDAKVTVGGMSISADSHGKVYAIPAIGISVPITNTFPLWRFGLAAYGVSGLGVDYRNTDIDNPAFFNFGPMGNFPLVAADFTQLQIMKFSPTVAYQPNENVSLGLGVHINYANLDLKNGSSFNYALGVQLGAIYKFNDMITLGATYTSPQKVDYKNVSDLDSDGTDDDLKLEQPQEAGLGIALNLIPGKLLVEGDVKWLNWQNADGYSDFDWGNQWVFAIGAQFKPIKKIALRIGYNYSKNPLKEHDNFNGAEIVSVQGKMMPRYYYETFRIIGFPAIVQHHLTMGVGYEFSNKFALHAGYMHAFKESIKENGTAPDGMTPATLESGLSEDSLEFGLTLRF